MYTGSHEHHDAISALVVILLCGAWLTLCEGAPAGVAPLSFADVLLIRNQYDRGMSTMCLAFGIFFIVCFAAEVFAHYRPGSVVI